MNSVIRFFRFFLLSGLPFFSYSAEQNWIPPLPPPEFWQGNGNGPIPDATDPDGACQNIWDSFPTADILSFTITFTSSTSANCIFKRDFGQLDLVKGVWVSTVGQPICSQPDFQLAIDSDSDGIVDQCHPTTCPGSDFLWASSQPISTGSGSICIQQPNGQNCEYAAIQNTDGSTSQHNFSTTGTGCSCGDEAMPCHDGLDGEITNTPLPDGNSCQAMGGAIFCEADEEDHCEAGVCDSGCGNIGTSFVCLQDELTPEESAPCVSNDLRGDCSGVPEGDCPEGILNCAVPEDDPNEPAPCVANDTRGECAGVPDGGAPINSNGGIESRLDTSNKLLKEIKDINQKSLDELKREFTNEDFEPAATDINDIKNTIIDLTSDGHIPSSQSDFESNFSGQEGFFNNQIVGMLPSSGGCNSFILGFMNISIDACDALGIVKLILEWMTALLAVVYIRNLFLTIKPTGA